MTARSKDKELRPSDHEVRIPLDPMAWQEFCDLLDRPARVPAGLEALFSTPAVFECADGSGAHFP